MADLFLAQVHGPAGYERSVVVKTLRNDLADEEALVAQIAEEARIVSALRHENIVPTFEVGEEGGTRFLAMEFVFGRTLQQVIDRCVEQGVAFPPRHAVTILCDCLEALAYAHEEVVIDGRRGGVIHRDVSPANLMVGFDGLTRLLDFGLAKGKAQFTRTRAGVVKGRYGYMSPEQVLREDLDIRSDLFSTGVVLWELLTERRLFARTNELETIEAVLGTRIPFAKWVRPDVPLGLSLVAFWSLQRRRDWRFSSAVAMRSALRARDPRSVEEARDDLLSWIRTLFHVELSARDLALQRARAEPTTFRMLRDSGFELLPEVTDPAIPTRSRGPSIEAAPPTLSRWAVLAGSRWFGVVLVGLVFFSLGLGLLIGRSQAPMKPIGFIYVICDHSAEVRIGSKDVGRTPVQRVPVFVGRHRIFVTYGHRVVEREVEVREGQNRLVKVSFDQMSGSRPQP